MFLYIQTFNFILNFRINALCCVGLEAGEVFGVLILANFEIILFGRNFFLLKYVFEVQLYSSFSGFDIGGCLLDWRL